MSALVNAVLVTVLWLAGHFLAKWLLADTGCVYSATILFSWWIVTYFTKNINTNPVTIFVTFVVTGAAIMSSFYAGYQEKLFPSIPDFSHGNMWISFMILAFVMVTPLIFNLIVRYITKAIDHAV